MQFKVLATLVLGATSALAAATSSPSNQCNTGTLQCCDSTGKATDPSISKLLGLLGVVIQDVTALVGVTCSPITAVGVGGTSCSQQTVCCADNSFKGVVALGCTPINVGL